MPFRHTVIAVSIGAGAALVLGSGVALYGAHREVAGVTKERARAEAAQRAMTEAYQLEKDRADAQYRGAVAGRDPANPRAGRRPDEAGPDWIGGFAACYAEYGDLATDAAEWADQVNGLQGYIRGVRGAMP